MILGLLFYTVPFRHQSLLGYGTAISYAICRFCIFGLALAAFRNSPANVYEKLSWSSYWGACRFLIRNFARVLMGFQLSIAFASLADGRWFLDT